MVAVEGHQGAPRAVVDQAVRVETGHHLVVEAVEYPVDQLLTGLTRDGVFLVENGEVVGAVNNFRFNESPVSMLRRVGAAGATVNTLAREWGDYFTRTRMPALRIERFNMSSVSQAS